MPLLVGTPLVGDHRPDTGKGVKREGWAAKHPEWLVLTKAGTGPVWRHMALTLTTDERTELERRVRSLKIRAEDARRARVILMLADRDSYSTIEATIPCLPRLPNA